MSTSSGSTRSGLATTALVIVASAVWFGFDVIGVAARWWADDLSILLGLIGAVALALAHSRQAGGRWLTGVALAVLPAIVLLSGPVLTADDGARAGWSWTVAGAVLAGVTMTAAGWVRRRFGEAIDKGGASFYG